jgi:hypothetical protein
MTGLAGAFSVSLRVDAPSPAPDAMLSAASDALRTRVYAELGLKPRSVAWVTVVPGTRKGDEVLARLIARREAGELVVGSATLTETIAWDQAGTAEWFLLDSKVVDDFSLWDDYPRCKAGTLPKVHALNHTFVSSGFRTLCLEQRLRGVSFLQCENRGRKPGEPWFVALPDHSLGRGLDHPWFDRARWLRDVSHRPDRRSSSLDMGQSSFHQHWLRDDAREEPLATLLRLCPMAGAYPGGIVGLQIVTIPRYWSGAVPDADFAYVPWGEDGPNREGKILRFRWLTVSQQARAALIGGGLFDPRAFLPVAIVRDVPAEQPVLDRLHAPIPPMYTPAELAVLRERQSRLTGDTDD